MVLSVKYNTALVLIYIILNILYTINSATTTSLIGLMNWLTISLIVFLSLQSKKDKFSIKFFYLIILYFILHYLTGGQTYFFSMMLCVLNIMLFISIANLHIDPKPIAYSLLLLMLVNIFVGYEQIINLQMIDRTYGSFRGMFNNGNTNANFAGFVLTSVFLFVRNKKIRYFTLLLFIIYLVGCKSRNILLFSLVAFFMNYVLSSSKWKNKALLIYISFFIFLFVFLIIIEPNMIGDGPEIFGKKAESAGRSEQILLTMNQFPLTFFGIGSSIPDEYITRLTHFAIHNMYVNSIFAMGIVYMLLYFIFILYLYKELKSNTAKSFLLAFHIYFMFEPGMAFGSRMINSLPILIILLKLSQERYENSSLHTIV